MVFVAVFCVTGKEEERQMFQQMQAMAQKQVRSSFPHVLFVSLVVCFHFDLTIYIRAESLLLYLVLTWYAWVETVNSFFFVFLFRFSFCFISKHFPFILFVVVVVVVVPLGFQFWKKNRFFSFSFCFNFLFRSIVFHFSKSYKFMEFH